MDKEKKIILIGYRCTGKTSTGKRLAELLGLPFVDTDALVETIAGQSIRSMVEAEGWPYFREIEKKAIMTLTSLDNGVISTGGGAVMDEDNASILKKEGCLIWLIADEETILKRMRNDRTSKDQRPPLSDNDLRKEITESIVLRTPLYRQLADYSVDTTGLEIEECVKKILCFLAERQDEMR